MFAKSPSKGNSIYRWATTILFFYRVADDVIDEELANSGRDVKEVMMRKFLYIFEEGGLKPRTIRQEAAFFFARELGRRYAGNQDFRNCFHRLVTCLIKQLTVTTADEALKLSQDIGAECVLALAISMIQESRLRLDDRNTNVLYQTARTFGGAAQICDDLVDIEENYREGIQTYPLIKLAQRIPLKAGRLHQQLKQYKIHADVLDLARDSLQQAYSSLNTKQQFIYKFMSQGLLHHTQRLFKNHLRRRKVRTMWMTLSCVILIAIPEFFGLYPKYAGRFLAEVPGVLHDWVQPSIPPEETNLARMDIHVHFDSPHSYPNGVLSIIETCMDRLEIVGITNRGIVEDFSSSSSPISYDEFKHTLKDLPSSYHVEDLGRILRISNHANNQQLIAIRAQEVETTEKIEIIALGCKSYLPARLDTEDLILRIRREDFLYGCQVKN